MAWRRLPAPSEALPPFTAVEDEEGDSAFAARAGRLVARVQLLLSTALGGGLVDDTLDLAPASVLVSEV